jgi:hypothetical protein
MEKFTLFYKLLLYKTSKLASFLLAIVPLFLILFIENRILKKIKNPQTRTFKNVGRKGI